MLEEDLAKDESLVVIPVVIRVSWIDGVAQSVVITVVHLLGEVYRLVVREIIIQGIVVGRIIAKGTGCVFFVG